MDELQRIDVSIFEGKKKPKPPRLLLSDPSSCGLEELLKNAERLGIKSQVPNHIVKLPPPIQLPSFRIECQLKPHRLMQRQQDQRFAQYKRKLQRNKEQSEFAKILKKYFQQ